MIFYLVVLIVTILPVYYIERHVNKNFRDKWLSLAFIAIFIGFVVLAGMRSMQVGNDLANYHEYYRTDYYYSIEPGYVMLSRMVKHLGISFRGLMLIVEAVIAFPILFAISKQSNHKWLSLFLYQGFYLFANSFNIYRQSIAMSIVVLALYFLFTCQNKIKKYGLSIFFILLATSFHISAIIFLPLVILKDLKINSKWLFVSVGFSALVFLYRNEFINFLMQLFSREYYVGFKPELGISTVFMFGLLFVIVLYNLKQRELILEKGVNNFIFNLSFYALLLNVFGIWFPNHARISMYIYLIYAIYYPNTLSDVKKRKLLLIELSVVIIATLGLYIYQLQFRDYGGVVPYKMMGVPTHLTILESKKH